MTKPAIWITFVSCANELYDKEEKEGKEAPYFEVANVMKYRSLVFFSVPIMISIPTKSFLSST